MKRINHFIKQSVIGGLLVISPAVILFLLSAGPSLRLATLFNPWPPPSPVIPMRPMLWLIC